MKLLAANLASTTLGSNLASSGTTLTLAAGTGAEFPAPTPGTSYFLLSLFQAGSVTDQPNEIVQVTNRVGDTCTIVRAQEGTSALNWSVGDTAANQWTAGSMLTFAQEGDVFTQAGNYGVDTGSANAGAVTLSSAPGSLAALVGVPVRVLKAASANTGAYTLNVNALGAIAVDLPASTPMTGGELPASCVYEVVYDGTRFQLQSAPAVLQPDSVDNTILAEMPAHTFKTNPTGASADPQDVDVDTLLGMTGQTGSTNYIKIPLASGQVYVRQWGNGSTLTPNTGETVTYPVPMTTPEGVSLTTWGTAAGAQNSVAIYVEGSLNGTSFEVWMEDFAAGSTPPQPYSWEVWGFL